MRPVAATASDARRKGLLIAKALGGAWRRVPPPLDEATLPGGELDAIWERVARLGGAGLLSRRLRAAGRGGAVVNALRDAHRLQALDEARQARALARIAAALGAHGIEPLVIKGLALACGYPEPGLRASCDIDLVVEDSRVEEACARAREAAEDIDVDVHGLAALRAAESGGGREGARDRAFRASLRGVEARVPAPGDHLRLVVLHLLEHGAWRPLWLCDAAMLAEGEAAELAAGVIAAGGSRWETEAIGATLGLARDLLGARLTGGAATLARTPPDWMRETVLAEWGGGPHPYPALAAFPREPAALLAEALRRFPNPIRATFALRAPFAGVPRLPLQAFVFVRRVLQFGGAARPTTPGATVRA